MAVAIRDTHFNIDVSLLKAVYFDLLNLDAEVLQRIPNLLFLNKMLLPFLFISREKSAIT